MEFRITIDIFSGRKNPVIELKGREAAKLYERLRPARRLSGREMLPIPPSIVGYRAEREACRKPFGSQMET